MYYMRDIVYIYFTTPHLFLLYTTPQRVCNYRKKENINTICLAIEIHREPRVSIINFNLF